MNTSRVLATVLSAATLALAAGCGSSAAPVTLAPGSDAGATCGVVPPHSTDPHWSYGGADGPANWATLMDSTGMEPFSLCASGMRQSPVDLVTASATPGTGPGLTAPTYADVRGLLFNNGHTVQFNVDTANAPAGSLTLDGKAYQLVQFHFHAPSEYTLNGMHLPLEVHFVHQAADMSLAVVGVLFSQAATANSFLASLGTTLPAMADANSCVTTAGLGTVIPFGTSPYFRFDGSLTTPRCSEGVKWIEFQNPMAASAAQISAFATVFGADGNARPVQPVAGRTITLYSGL